MGTPCFYLNVHIRGYDSEIFVNGAPIMRSHRGHGVMASPPVSEWLVQGDNEILVVVDPVPAMADDEPSDDDASGDDASGDDASGDDASGDEPEPEPPVLRVALCQGEVGEMVEPGTEHELAVIQGQPPADASLGHEQRVTTQVSHPWGRWRWEDGPVLDPAQEAEAADLVPFLADIHAAVAANRLDPLLDASLVNFDEVAPCYDVSPADARSRLPSAWGEITAAPGWALAPFDPVDLELRPCCEGRVLEPRTRTGEPILRQVSGSGGTHWRFPMFLARLDGTLRIVR